MPELPVVLIPSLQPDDKLPTYTAALREAGFQQILVVDDGSGPQFAPVFAHVEAQGCTVLHHLVNRGKGAALKLGYDWIGAHWADAVGVLTADSDGQHTVPDCLRLAQCLSEGDNALYLGSRDFSLENVPKKSRYGNRITSTVFKLLYGVWLPDTQTGLRAFRMSELAFMAGVEGARYEYEMNVLIAAARRKLPMVPVTIETVYENDNQGTHFHPVRDSWRIYKVILGNFLRFMGSSLFCYLIDQGVAALLCDSILPALGVPVMSAISIGSYGARVVSSIINFLLNKNLVFHGGGDSKTQALRYFALCLVIIVLSTLGTKLLVSLGMVRWLAKGICDLLLYFVSYRVQRVWVFPEET